MPKRVFIRADGTHCAQPPTKALARKMHRSWYDSGSPCPECSTTYARFVIGDKCIHCARLEAIEAYETATLTLGEPEGQEVAIRRGWNHYWRPEMCLKAGCTGKRSTATGECVECLDKNKQIVSLIQDVYPSMVIGKQAARTMGFKVYRTGKSCRRGHSGWRYISTGGCIKCKVGDYNV